MKTINRNISIDKIYQDILDIKKKEIDKKNILRIEKGKEKLAYEYALPEVQDYLRNTYKGVCCFCESKFEFSSYMQIEHFYPKNDNCYPEYICNIKNLHYSCQICNNKKLTTSPGKRFNKSKKYKNGDKLKFYSPNYILDETTNIFNKALYHPLENQFTYNYFRIKSKDKVAKNTIKLFGLDGTKERKSLITKRIEVFDRALGLSEEIRKSLNNNSFTSIGYFFNELSNMMNDNSSYSTMIKKQFGEIYINLYEAYELRKELNS